MNIVFLPEAIQHSMFGAMVSAVFLGYGAGATIGVSVIALRRLRRLYDDKRLRVVSFVGLVSLVISLLGLAFLIAPIGVSATQRDWWDTNWLLPTSLYLALLVGAAASWFFSDVKTGGSLG